MKDIFYVPDIRKNLELGFILLKKRFKTVFKSGQVVLSKSGSFVGKWYIDESLFKLNFSVINNKVSTSSTYLLDYYNLWHVGFGYFIIAFT